MCLYTNNSEFLVDKEITTYKVLKKKTRRFFFWKYVTYTGPFQQTFKYRIGGRFTARIKCDINTMLMFYKQLYPNEFHAFEVNDGLHSYLGYESAKTLHEYMSDREPSNEFIIAECVVPVNCVAITGSTSPYDHTDDTIVSEELIVKRILPL